jgi:hypothetical protein
MKVLVSNVPFVLVAALLLAAAGCEPSSTPDSAAKPAGAAAAITPAAGDGGLPASLWLTTEPTGAKPVAEVKKTATAGQNVVVFGRIGGGKEPFVTGRAMFMLADRSMPSCVEKHGPGCATPWDYCCEPKETVLASTTTVQIVGPDGKPLKQGLSGEHGLKPLTDVVIAGEVSSAGENVVIDATGIFIKP